MSEKWKRIGILCLTGLFFIVLNLCVFFGFTYKNISDNTNEMQAKSIALDEYLPFAEESQVYKSKGSLVLEGRIPVLDAAAALYPVSSGFAHAVYPENSVLFNGKDFIEGSSLVMHNTRGAYQMLVDGGVDIGILAKPSKEQMEYAESKGVRLKLTPIGYEAFVFLVNKDNPVESVTVEELRGIYSGEITNWKALGGQNRPIYPLQRNLGSGSQTAFLKLMGDTEAKRIPPKPNCSAIGFSFRFYVTDVVQNGRVKMLALDGVEPSIESIRDKSYPVVSSIYAVTRENEENPNVEKMIDWILGPEGQKIIEESGYVGI